MPIPLYEDALEAKKSAIPIDIDYGQECLNQIGIGTVSFFANADVFPISAFPRIKDSEAIMKSSCEFLDL